MNRDDERKKNYSKANRSSKRNKEDDVNFDDIELLRIQGLIRCNSCKTPCPINDVICPTCGAKA